MSEKDAEQGAREAYWDQLVLLKGLASYARHYRDEQTWWITRIGLFKAIVTSGTTGGS